MNYNVIQVSQLIQWQVDILSEAQAFDLRGSCGPHRSRHSKLLSGSTIRNLPPPPTLLAFFVLRASLRLKKGSAIILPVRDDDVDEIHIATVLHPVSVPNPLRLRYSLEVLIHLRADPRVRRRAFE